MTLDYNLRMQNRLFRVWIHKGYFKSNETGYLSNNYGFKTSIFMAPIENGYSKLNFSIYVFSVRKFYLCINVRYETLSFLGTWVLL